MALARDVLKEFVVSVAWEMNKGLQQQVVRSVDEVTAATRRQGVEERRATEDARRLTQDRARFVRQMGQETANALQSTIGTTLRTITFQLTTFYAAFASIRAIKVDVAGLAELASTARELHTTPATFAALERSLKGAGEALASLQSNIRESPGFKTFLRDALGVTEFDDYSKTLVQIGTKLSEIAKTSESLAYQYGKQVGLSEQVIAQFLRPEFMERLERSRRIIEAFSGKLDENTRASKAFDKAWDDLASRFTGITHQLSGAISNALTPSINEFARFVDLHAPTINRQLEELSTGLSKWGAEKGKDLTEWLTKLADPNNTTVQQQWSAFFDNAKTLATDVATAVITIATNIDRATAAARALVDAMRTVKNAIVNPGGVVDIVPGQPSGIPDENKGPQGGFWDQGGTRRFFRDLIAPESKITDEAQKRLDIEKETTREKEKQAGGDTGAPSLSPWQRIKNFFTQAPGAGQGLADKFTTGGTFGSEKLGIGGLPSSILQYLFGGAGVGGGGGIAEGMGMIGPAGRGSAGLPGGPGNSGVIGPVQPGGVGRWWTKERLQFGTDYLKKNLGLNDTQARAAIARFAAVESPNKGADEGGGGYRGRAQGIGQWLGARRSGYEVGNYESQLAKVVQEMQGGESRAYQRLKNANTSQEAAEAMEDYERATSPTVSRASLVRKTMAGAAGIDQILGGGDSRASQQAKQSFMAAIAAKDAAAGGDTVTSGLRSPNDPLTRANPRSSHAKGLAFDLRARNAEQADAAIARQRERFAARGMIPDRDYKILDEVRHPSGHATGPHVHVQLTPEGAAKYNNVAQDAEGGGQSIVSRLQEARNGANRASQTLVNMNRPDFNPAQMDAMNNASNSNTSSIITNGPTTNDNSSRNLNFSPTYNTKITAQDTRQAASQFSGVQEDLTKAALRQMMPNVK